MHRLHHFRRPKLRIGWKMSSHTRRAASDKIPTNVPTLKSKPRVSSLPSSRAPPMNDKLPLTPSAPAVSAEMPLFGVADEGQVDGDAGTLLSREKTRPLVGEAGARQLESSERGRQCDQHECCQYKDMRGHKYKTTFGLVRQTQPMQFQLRIVQSNDRLLCHAEQHSCRRRGAASG